MFRRMMVLTVLILATIVPVPEGEVYAQRAGKALSLDGDGDYVSTSSSVDFANEVSWCYWINLSDFAATGSQDYWATPITNHISNQNGFYNIIDSDNGYMHTIVRKEGTEYKTASTILAFRLNR